MSTHAYIISIFTIVLYYLWVYYYSLLLLSTHTSTLILLSISTHERLFSVHERQGKRRNSCQQNSSPKLSEPTWLTVDLKKLPSELKGEQKKTSHSFSLITQWKITQISLYWTFLNSPLFRLFKNVQDRSIWQKIDQDMAKTKK